jgi:hypothetical protein
MQLRYLPIVVPTEFIAAPVKDDAAWDLSKASRNAKGRPPNPREMLCLKTLQQLICTTLHSTPTSHRTMYQGFEDVKVPQYAKCKSSPEMGTACKKERLK